MSAPEKVRSVLRELEIHQYDLLYQVTRAGKPHDFSVRVCDVTLRGCTTRAIIRAIRRSFAPNSGAKNRGKISCSGASSTLAPA